MAKIKMECGVYYNNIKFAVGRKYVTIRTLGDRVLAQAELTPWIVSKLTAIKEEYDRTDVRRTRAVIRLVYGVGEDYEGEIV